MLKMNKIESKLLIGQRFVFDPYDNSLVDKLEEDELTRLGTNESRALCLLVEEPGAIITRTRLHNYVWREQGFEVDDSSLTQAISTLRKALKDSTKSPEFIKTVPKRGYQMIASVETLSDSTPPVSESEPAEAILDGLPVAELDDAATVSTPSASGQTNTAHYPAAGASHASVSHHYMAQNHAGFGSLSHTSAGLKLASIIALLLAFVMPLIVTVIMPQKSSAFTQLTQIDGIPVLVPQNHPSVSQWETMISQCVESYLEYHQGDRRPTEVIATGGQSAQLWLNYVHNDKIPNENVTLRLLTSNKDNATLCQ